MSKIEWTDETWNPIIGCDKISPGCKNCYAEKMAHRLAHNPKAPTAYQHVTNHDGKWTGLTELHYPALIKPLNWKKPRKIFVCSMGDLFHESISFDWINKVFDTIMRTPQHIYQILTKRPERMMEYFDSYYSPKGSFSSSVYPIDNIWLGVTAENQEMAQKRIPVLLQIPAKVKFVSIEPMLSAIDLKKWLIDGIGGMPHELEASNNQLNWVICGGETGHNARPMHPDWVISLQKQCEISGTPFFFKQWGEWLPSYDFGERLSELYSLYRKLPVYYSFPDGQGMNKIGKKMSGSLLQNTEYKQFPNQI